MTKTHYTRVFSVLCMKAPLWGLSFPQFISDLIKQTFFENREYLKFDTNIFRLWPKFKNPIGAQKFQIGVAPCLIEVETQFWAQLIFFLCFWSVNRWCMIHYTYNMIHCNASNLAFMFPLVTVLHFSGKNLSILS